MHGVFAFALLLLLLVSTASGALPALQRNAMNALCSFTTVFRYLDNWCVSDVDMCAWEGVTCAAGNTIIRELRLTGSSLTGAWPAAFDAQMFGLEVFEINGAQFTGTLSNTFFVRNRETLRLLWLTELPFLRLSVSTITAANLPYPHLLSLRIKNVRVSGNIGNTAATNPLNAPLLREFTLDEAGLEGTLVDSYFDHVVASIVGFSMRKNALTGAFPLFVCNAANLVALRLNGNRFNEPIHECYETLHSFDTCQLDDNYNCESLPTFDPAKTYSNCAVDTEFNSVRDSCGICGGDGSDCHDCAGAVDGTTVVDACGLCGGDGSSCLDCAGVPAGSSVYDICDVCGGSAACADCSGDIGGTLVRDVCGVCGGDGTSCVDCNGVLLGTSRYDNCGVCDGDGAGCFDCAGTEGGSATYDACGVCGGTATECLDCAGVDGGSLRYDECGVCGGDNSSCGIDPLRSGDGVRTWIAIGWVVSAVVIVLLAAMCVMVMRARAARRKAKADR